MIEYEIEKNGVKIKKVPVHKPKKQKGKNAVRAEHVEKLTITTKNGNVFDADEISQTRMHRAISVMTWNNISTVKWVLADNTKKEIDIEEMKEALTLASQEQSNLWFSF